MKSSFENEVICITGASSGLGRELAKQLVQKGAKLALFARRKEALQESEKIITTKCSPNLPAQIHVCIGDVTSKDDCQRFIQSTLKRFGAINYVINNAGIGMQHIFGDAESLDLAEQMIQTNYLGCVYMSYAVLPSLKATKGMLVTISSVQGITGVPGRSGYAASKHALEGFVDTLRYDIPEVRQLIIRPGWIIGTDFNPIGNSNRKKKGLFCIPVSVCASKIIKGMQKNHTRMTLPAYMGIIELAKCLFPRTLRLCVFKAMHLKSSNYIASSSQKIGDSHRI